MSFKIKRESKVLKSLIIGLALLLISWGGVELTLRPGLSSSDNSGNDWLLDGIDSSGTGWHNKDFNGIVDWWGGLESRVKDESPYLMIGTDGGLGHAATNGFEHQKLILSWWIPDDVNQANIEAYELCHNGWDGKVSPGEQTSIYIVGGGKIFTGETAGRDSGYCQGADTLETVPVSITNNKNNHTQYIRVNGGNQINATAVMQKDNKYYFKYTIEAHAEGTKQANLYYSLFKLRTTAGILTHEGAFQDNDYSTSVSDFIDQAQLSDDHGIALAHGFPLLHGTLSNGNPAPNRDKFRKKPWQATFITATDPKKNAKGALGLIGLYDGDYPEEDYPHNSQVQAAIYAVERHNYKEDGSTLWGSPVETLNFEGCFTDGNKHEVGSLSQIQEVLAGNISGSHLNGLRRYDPDRHKASENINGFTVTKTFNADRGDCNRGQIKLDKNEWEDFYYYFETSKVYKIHFSNIAAENYVQFKVPFEYTKALVTEDPAGKIKIAQDNQTGKCYLYIHHLEHLTDDPNERTNEIQLTLDTGKLKNHLVTVKENDIKKFWADQKNNLDEDPFVYDDHKGSALKPYKDGFRKQDLNGRRVIAEIKGAVHELREKDLTITATHHRPQNSNAGVVGTEYEPSKSIKFEPLPEGKRLDCKSLGGEIDIDLNTCRVFFRYLNTKVGNSNLTATVFVYKPGTKTVLVDNGANKIVYEDRSEKGFYGNNTFKTLAEKKTASNNRTIFALTNPALPSNKVNISLAQSKWLHDYEFEITIPGQPKPIKIPTTEGFAKKLEQIKSKKHKCTNQNVLHLGYDNCRLYIKTLNLTINKRQPDIQVQFYRNGSLLGSVHYEDNTPRPLPHKTFTQHGQAVNRYSQNLSDSSSNSKNINTLMLLTKESLPRTEDTKPAKIRWFNMIADQSLEVRVYKYHDGSAWKDLSTVLPSGVDYLNIIYPSDFPNASYIQTDRTANCSPLPPLTEQCETNAGTNLSEYIKRSYDSADPSLVSSSSSTYSPSYKVQGPNRPSSGHHDWGEHYCERIYRCPSGYTMSGTRCTKPVEDSTSYSPNGRGEDAYCRGGEIDAIHNWRGHVIDCERTTFRTVTTDRIYVGCNMIHRDGIHDEPGRRTILWYNLGSDRTGEVNIQWSQFKDLDDTLLEQILGLNHGDNWQSLDSQALVSLRNNRSAETSYAGKLNILNANVNKGLNLVAVDGRFSKFDFSSLPVSRTATKTMRGATTGHMSAVLEITVKQVSRLGGGSLSSSPSSISSGGTLTAADPSASNPGIHIYKWALEWELLITETFAWQWQTYNPVSKPDIHTTSPPNLNSWSTRNASAQRTVKYSGDWSVCSRSLVVDPPTCQVITKNNAAIDYEQEEFDANAVGGSNTNNHFVYPVGINNAFTKFQVINPNKIGLNAGASYSINGTTGAYAPGPTNDISRRSVAQQLVAHVKSSSNNVELHQNAHTMNLPGKYGIHWQPSWTVERSSQDWGSNTADWDGAIPPPSTVCSNDPSTPPNTYTSWFYIYADPPTCRVEYTVFEVDDPQTRVTVTLNNPNAVPMTIDRLEYSINRPGSGSNNENSVNVLNKNGNGHTIAANKKTILKSNRKPRNITGQFDFEWTIRTKIGNEYWLTDNDDTGQDSWFEDIDERITFAGGDCQQTLRIVRRPYLKTFYGGLIVGGTYGAKHTSDSCSAAGKINNPNADDFVYAHSTTDASTPKGSSAQFHVQVYDQIAGFYSANLRNNPPKPFKGLTIGQQGDFGGHFNQKQCLANLWQRIDGISVQTVDNLNLNSLDPKNNDDDKRVYIKPDSGTLTLNSNGGNNLGTLRTTLYVDGDIIINENIINNDDPKWTDYKDIGYITIIAKGNIYIHPSVSRIDAFLVAYPLTNSQGNYESKGEVFTCKEGPSSNFDATNHFNSLCNNPLTINGAIYAQKLRPGRIFKSVLQAADHPADNPTNSKASEMILLLPEYIIGIPELPNFTDEDFLVDAIFVGAPPF